MDEVKQSWDGLQETETFHLSKPHPVSETVVSSRKVPLPAHLDFTLPVKWEDVPSWNSSQHLRNPRKLASIGKLCRAVDAIPGQSHFRCVRLPSGIPGFNFHFVTLNKTFLWECFLNEPMPSVKYKRWQNGLPVAELRHLCWLMFVSWAAMTDNVCKAKLGGLKPSWWLQYGDLSYSP